MKIYLVYEKENIKEELKYAFEVKMVDDIHMIYPICLDFNLQIEHAVFQDAKFYMTNTRIFWKTKSGGVSYIILNETDWAKDFIFHLDKHIEFAKKIA